MAKKVKCINCREAARFAIPSKKYVLDHMESYNHIKLICVGRLSCERIMKTKPMDNEQYCKHYEESDDWRKEYMRSAEKDWNKKFREIEEGREREKIIEEKQKIWKQSVMNVFLRGCGR